MNAYTISGLIISIIGSIIMIYGGNVDLINYDKNKKKVDFENEINGIINGPNPDANFEHFSKFTVNTLTEDQLKYIYANIDKCPYPHIFYDFLTTICDKPSESAKNFYRNYLKNKNGIVEQDRALIFNVFRDSNFNEYQNEFGSCIVRGNKPLTDLKFLLEIFQQSSGDINFVKNLMNDKILIDAINIDELVLFYNLSNNPSNFMMNIQPSWRNSYFEKVCIEKIRNTKSVI